MEITYLRFKRPDGTIFNKLTAISSDQADAYKQAGCKLIGTFSRSDSAPQMVQIDKPALKKRAAKKG